MNEKLDVLYHQVDVEVARLQERLELADELGNVPERLALMAKQVAFLRVLVLINNLRKELV